LVMIWLWFGFIIIYIYIYKFINLPSGSNNSLTPGKSLALPKYLYPLEPGASFPSLSKLFWPIFYIIYINDMNYIIKRIIKLKF